ncbi:hypothetical protein KKI24_28170 [bacterium]|nr:hypothetical protein [bacterium]
MKKLPILVGLFVLFCFSLTLHSCKSSDDDDDDVTTTATSTAAYTGVAVDPYISGAVFCEDKNNNASCDSDEQVSTASSASGVFQFANAVTAGSSIIVKTQGTHNGVTYTINLARKIDSTADTTNQVVSPLTTLAAKSLTAQQVAAMLQFAGLSDITAADITADPMTGIASMTGTITEAQVVRIRSCIAVYAFIRIMNGSTTLRSLSGTELYLSATTSGHAVNTILSTMVTFVKSGLNPSLVATLQSAIDAAPVTLPVITAEDVARTAVAITDYISKTGYETCNATTGDYQAKVTAAMAAVQTATGNGANVAGWASELGQNFYAVRNKGSLTPYSSHLNGFPHIQAGMNCGSGTFEINSAGAVACYSQ